MAIIPEVYPEFSELATYEVGDIVISEEHEDGNLWHCVAPCGPDTWENIQQMEVLGKGNRGGFAVGGISNVG